MAPHLVRAQSAYKDLRIHSFQQTHTHRDGTHTHTHTVTHTHTHTLYKYMHYWLWIGKTTGHGMQRRRQRWGCQFLLKRSEDECLTERGMEFQNTGPMYWMDLSPRVFLPILDAGLRLPSSSGKGCRKARRGVPRVTACWCDPIQPFSPSAVVPRHCIKQGRLEFCKLVWPLSDLLSLPPRHWQCRQVCLNMRTELQWTAGWRPNPATLRASLSGRCRKPVLGVRAGSCQSLFCNNIMPNERKVTTRTTSLWMEVSGPRLTWVTKEGGFVRRPVPCPVQALFASLIWAAVTDCLSVSRKLPVLPKRCLWIATDSFSVCLADRNDTESRHLEPKMIVAGTILSFWPSSCGCSQ